MIASAPLAAATPFETIAEKVRAYLVVAKAVASAGLTWAEFGELLVGLLRLAIETLDLAGNLTGPEKKAIVLEAVAALFDTVADRLRVPILATPPWILARPAIRSLVLALAAGAVEQILPLVRLAK